MFEIRSYPCVVKRITNLLLHPVVLGSVSGLEPAHMQVYKA